MKTARSRERPWLISNVFLTFFIAFALGKLLYKIQPNGTFFATIRFSIDGSVDGGDLGVA